MSLLLHIVLIILGSLLILVGAFLVSLSIFTYVDQVRTAKKYNEPLIEYGRDHMGLPESYIKRTLPTYDFDHERPKSLLLILGGLILIGGGIYLIVL